MNTVEKKKTQPFSVKNEKTCEFIKNQKNLNKKNLVDDTWAIN
jgi:hypothetical protein